jgi:hypothetical protein
MPAYQVDVTESSDSSRLLKGAETTLPDVPPKDGIQGFRGFWIRLFTSLVGMTTSEPEALLLVPDQFGRMVPMWAGLQ